MMKWSLLILLGLFILIGFVVTDCAPLIIGGAAGYLIEKHEARRDRCMRFFGNPDCRPGYGEHHVFFPMGVHK